MARDHRPQIKIHWREVGSGILVPISREMKGTFPNRLEAPSGRLTTARRPALLWAALSAALVLAWWAATVRCSYGGNWTALYWSGADFRTPPQLSGENIHRRPGAGFDGQFYHYLAHDPLMRWSMPYLDAPGLRAKRILVPGLAHVLFGGRGVDVAYLAVTLALISLGVYWLGRWAQLHGRNAAWGLLFLLSGATIGSIDNLTIDVALAALAVGFVYAGSRGGKLAAATLAGLARETGVLLAAAGVLTSARKKQWRDAAFFACSAAPFAIWNVYVAISTPSYGFEMSWVPFSAIAGAVFNPVRYPTHAPVLELTVVALEYVALAGGLLAMWLALRAARTSKDVLGLVVILFAILSIAVQQRDVWLSVWGFARVFAPLYILLAMHALERRAFKYAIPLLMMAPRCLVMLAPQALGIARSF